MLSSEGECERFRRRARCTRHPEDELVIEFQAVEIEQHDEPVGYVVTTIECPVCNGELGGE